MKAVLIAIAAAIVLAGCSAGGQTVADSSGGSLIGSLDKQGRAGHEN